MGGALWRSREQTAQRRCSEPHCSTLGLSVWWPTKGAEKKQGFFLYAHILVALPTGNHKLPFCFSCMLVGKARVTHSEHKKRGQGVAVRIQTHRLELDHKLQSTWEINTAPGASYFSSQKHIISFFPHFLISQHISAIFFSIISYLCVINISYPWWPTMASPAQLNPKQFPFLQFEHICYGILVHISKRVNLIGSVDLFLNGV